MKVNDVLLPNEQKLIEFAKKIAGLVTAQTRIYFSGEIGAGKTSFIRAMLQHRGVKERIKSPTFSIVECYCLDDKSLYHMDLYRLSDDAELEYLGFDEILSEAWLLLIEWPEKVASLPNADLEISLTIFDQGRRASLQSKSDKGDNLIAALGKLEAF